MKGYVYILFKEIYNSYLKTTDNPVSFEYFIDNMSELCSVELFNEHVKKHTVLNDTYNYFLKYLSYKTPHGHISKLFFFTTEYYLIDDKIIFYFRNKLRLEKLNSMLKQ